jgi:hypothetical protein
MQADRPRQKGRRSRVQDSNFCSGIVVLGSFGSPSADATAATTDTARDSATGNGAEFSRLVASVSPYSAPTVAGGIRTTAAASSACRACAQPRAAKFGLGSACASLRGAESDTGRSCARTHRAERPAQRLIASDPFAWRLKPFYSSKATMSGGIFCPDLELLQRDTPVLRGHSHYR